MNLLKLGFKTFFRRIRVLKYRWLSNLEAKGESPIRLQPLVMEGTGDITIGKNVKFGVPEAPGFYSTYCYLGARNQSQIILESNIWVNNGFKAVANNAGISIGEGTLIGADVGIYDSDFHNLNPAQRLSGVVDSAQVKIGKNCWIGERSIILKGAQIGDNSVIGAGSIVTSNIPSNTIAAGIPAKVLRSLEAESN